MKDTAPDTVKILVIQQGDVVCGSEGYMLKKSQDVAAFFLDGRGSSGRIYSLSYSTTSPIFNKGYDCPSLMLEDGEHGTEPTEICFPEYEGWSVHCTGGGKTMSICLIKKGSL